MIHVWRKGHTLTVNGRARYSIEDEYSACPTLATALQALCEACSTRRKGDVYTFDDGPAFDTICAAYETLTTYYPEHVYYERIN